MHKSQANHAVIAARVAAKPVTSRRRPVRGGQSFGYAGRHRECAKLTSTQRNSAGRRSEWRLSPYAPRGGWR